MNNMINGDRTLILSPESNNIDSIYIDGKKVAKILKDGKVFYDNLPTSITLTADKTIVTSGDTINLTATCLNQQEEGCRNKTVTFIDSDTGDVLATGVTDSQGVCTASFSVQSTGNLNIRAKWGIILSETYSIEAFGYYLVDSLTYTIPFDFTIADKDIIVECEFYPTNYGNWLYMILVDTSEVSKRIGVVSSSYDVHSEGLEIANAGYNKWIPLRIEYINGTATVYVNGSIKGDVTFTDVNAVLLRLNSSYTTKIRNIKLWF